MTERPQIRTIERCRWDKTDFLFQRAAGTKKSRHPFAGCLLFACLFEEFFEEAAEGGVFFFRGGGGRRGEAGEGFGGFLIALAGEGAVDGAGAGKLSFCHIEGGEGAGGFAVAAVHGPFVIEGGFLVVFFGAVAGLIMNAEAVRPFGAPEAVGHVEAGDGEPGIGRRAEAFVVHDARAEGRFFVMEGGLRVIAEGLVEIIEVCVVPIKELREAEGGFVVAPVGGGLVEGKTFRDYITEYMVGDYNEGIRRFAKHMGLDEALLGKLMDAHPTDKDINDFGYLSRLEDQMDVNRAKAYLERCFGKPLMPWEVKIKADNVLRAFILSRGKKLPGDPDAQPTAAETAEPYGGK